MYEEIPGLSGTILPGTKIELNADINYRNGVLFLKAANFKILGGNIEGITTKENLINAMQNQL